MQKIHKFNSRDLATEQQRLLHLRLTSSSQAFLVISAQPRPRFDSVYLELGPAKVAFGKFNGASSKEVASHPGITRSPADLWVFIDGEYIYVGLEGVEGRGDETLARCLHLISRYHLLFLTRLQVLGKGRGWSKPPWLGFIWRCSLDHQRW